MPGGAPKNLAEWSTSTSRTATALRMSKLGRPEEAARAVANVVELFTAA